MAGERRPTQPPSNPDRPAKAAAASPPPAPRPGTEETQFITLDLTAGAADACASVLVMNGKAAGRSYPVEGRELTIGRARECEIMLDDPGISRNHAKLVPESGGAVTLVDLKSTNGTFVNGRRIDRALLAAGDRVQLGASVLLKFSIRDRLEEECMQQLYESATRDPLTGVCNKRFLLERLEQEFSYCRRRGLPLSVLMMDVDHFRDINTNYGHTPAGDDVLKRLAETAARTVRSEDVFGRFGGEEFLLILRATASADAVRLAERLRRLIESAKFETADLKGNPVTIPVTVSIGAATLDDGNYDTAQALLSAADQMLYRAKERGRNRVADDSEADSESGADTAVSGGDKRPQPWQILVSRGVVSARDLQRAVLRQVEQRNAKPLEEVLIDMGFCTRADLDRAAAEAGGT